MSRRKGKVSESFAPWRAERARFLSQTERERVKHAMTCPSLVRQAWPWLENLLWPRMLYHIASSSTLFWGSVLFLDVFGWLAEAPEEASTWPAFLLHNALHEWKRSWWSLHIQDLEVEEEHPTFALSEGGGDCNFTICDRRWPPGVFGCFWVNVLEWLRLVFC